MNSGLPPEGGAENPFRSPAEPENQFDRQFIDSATIRHSGRYVRLVSTVAILMIVHGVILLLAGLGASALTIMFLIVPEIAEQMELPIRNMMVWIYGLVSVLLLTIATLQLVAGIRNLDFRSKTFGIVALLTGLASIFTCYCAPTSIGLAIFGLVVYLHPEAEQAFRLRSEGNTKEDVLAMLNV